MEDPDDFEFVPHGVGLRGKKGKGGGSKAESWLGVFAGDEDVRDSARNTGRGGGGRASKPLATKPLAFTKSSSTPQTDSGAGSGKGVGSSQATGGTGLGFGAGGGLGFAGIPGLDVEAVASGGGGGGGTTDARKRRRGGGGGGGGGFGSAAPAADFEKYTKGIGSKLLAKMGWQQGQGLGKEGRGISEPVAIKQRPNSMGLGFAGAERTAAQKRLDRQVSGMHGDEAAGDLEDGDDNGGPRRSKDGWKKGPGHASASQRAKTLLERLADEDVRLKAQEADAAQAARKAAAAAKRGRAGYLEGAAAAPPVAPSKILDMRGPMAREIVDLSQIHEQGGRGGNVRSQAAARYNSQLPELHHNVRLLVDMASSDLDAYRRRSERLVAERAALEAGAERAKRQVDLEAEQIGRLERLLDAVHKAQKRARAGELSVSALAQVFGILRTQFAPEFKLFRLSHLVVPWATPLIRRALVNWAPLAAGTVSDPATNEPVSAATLSAELVHDLFATWRRVLVDYYTGGSGISGAMSDPQAQSVARADDAFVYATLVEDTLLASARSALVREWDPSRNNAEAVEMVRMLVADGLMPESIVDQLLERTVLPTLLGCVRNWKPFHGGGGGGNRVHLWLGQWASLLGQARLEPLVGPAQQQLVAGLSQRWEPSDPAAAIAVLENWLPMLPAANVRGLIARSVIPRLDALLRASLVIDPAHQSLDVFNAAAAWLSFGRHGSTLSAADAAATDADAVDETVCPLAELVELFEKEFFPRWWAVLRAWLCTAPAQSVDLTEVVTWYQSWKAQFPAFAVRSSPRLRALFNHGLDLIRCAVSASYPNGQPGAGNRSMYWSNEDGGDASDGGIPESVLPDQLPFTSSRMLREQRAKLRALASTFLPSVSSNLRGGVGGDGDGGDGDDYDDDEGLSVRQTVEELCVEKGVQFVPTSRLRDGKPVYRVGQRQVVFDKNLVYSAVAGGKWVPVSIGILIGD